MLFSSTNCKLCWPFALALLLTALAQTALGQPSSNKAGTVPAANRLRNGTMECRDGYYGVEVEPGRTVYAPDQWRLAWNGAAPDVNSARVYFTGSCDGTGHVERIEGEDSMTVLSQDIEFPPDPGKPFDVSIWQQAAAVSGTAYSVSGWMLTLCGGSAVPNDCPSGVYMAKMLGIDPTGGTDPNSPAVVWTENRNNFVQPDGVTRIGWSNVRTAVTAQADTITVFARVNSPFQHHGAHGFVDALNLVIAPAAWLTVSTGAIGAPLTVAWDGVLGPDIPAIPNGKFRLIYDVQYWQPQNNAWRDLRQDVVGAGSALFSPRCLGSTYQFRVRPRAEQPDGVIGGASPNQRYPGVWSEPVSVFVPAPDAAAAFTTTMQVFLPTILVNEPC